MNKYLILILLAIPIMGITQIVEGKLYRETSKPHVYVIHGGRKVWIPTGDALSAMGYTWNQVNIVPDRSLNVYGEPVIIRSASKTPGSLIFPPYYKTSWNHYAGHYPIKVPSSFPSFQGVMSQGLYVQLVEIRGWLADTVRGFSSNGSANPEGLGADFSFDLIPDYNWLRVNNIDINQIIKVGNIAVCGKSVAGEGTTKKMVSIPSILVEVNSWLWNNRKPPLLNSPPSDWKKTPTFSWPFDPLDTLTKGQYVSVFGSLVSDGGHPSNAVWAGQICVWSPHFPCIPEEEVQYSRYTEIHPADLILKRQEDNTKEYQEQKETVYGLLLYADVTKTESFTCDLKPLAGKPKDGLWRIAYEEILGPECQHPNNDNNHYTRIQRHDDHITVTASTSGGAWNSGTPGRIRALYRVWWEPMPKDLLTSHSINYVNNKIELKVQVRNSAGSPIQNYQVFSKQNVYLGNSNAPVILNTNCTVIKSQKKKTIVDNLGKPIQIMVPCQIRTCSPAVEEYIIKSPGYADKRISVNFNFSDCN